MFIYPDTQHTKDVFRVSYPPTIPTTLTSPTLAGCRQLKSDEPVKTGDIGFRVATRSWTLITVPMGAFNLPEDYWPELQTIARTVYGTRTC